MKARWLSWLHLGLTVTWALLCLPTMLVWSQSVLWVGLISCYANAVGHASAWQATRAERRAAHREPARRRMGAVRLRPGRRLVAARRGRLAASPA